MDSEFVKQRDEAVNLLAKALEIVEKMPAFGNTKRNSKSRILHEIYMNMCVIKHTNIFLDTLTERTRNCLKRAKLVSVDEICAKTPKQLLEITNFGQKSLDELRDALTIIGRELTKEECTCGL